MATSAIVRAADQSDPAELVLDEAESAISQLSEQRISRGFMRVEEIVNTSFSSIDGLLQRGQRITGLATHYSRLDEMTSGLQPSDLIILAGRPSMGKTAFAMNIVENAAIDDQKTVAVFSLENGERGLTGANALLTGESRFPPNANGLAVEGGDAEGPDCPGGAGEGWTLYR